MTAKHTKGSINYHKVQQLSKEGMTVYQIAEYIGCGHSAIYDAIRRGDVNIDIRPVRCTIENVTSGLNRGLMQKEIAAEIGVRPNAVSSFIHRHNLIYGRNTATPPTHKGN